MNKYGFLLILLSALSLFSCNSIVDGRKGDNFGENQILWQKQNIENYSFEFRKLCYCGGLYNPSTVVVRADTIHAVLNTETEEPLRDPQTQELVFPTYSESFLTIDELFEVIKNAQGKADKLHAEYDRSLGYPTLVDIDYNKDMFDDEVTYQIDNFHEE